MTDRVLITGDKVIFSTKFGAADFVSEPTIKIIGSGKALINGKKVCLKGDEAKVLVACSYKTETHPLTGLGLIKIEALKDKHISKKLVVDSKQVLLQGEKFDAVFSVVTPALASPPPSADTTLKYKGEGKFHIEGERKWQSN